LVRLPFIAATVTESCRCLCAFSCAPLLVCYEILALFSHGLLEDTFASSGDGSSDTFRLFFELGLSTDVLSTDAGVLSLTFSRSLGSPSPSFFLQVALLLSPFFSTCLHSRCRRFLAFLPVFESELPVLQMRWDRFAYSSSTFLPCSAGAGAFAGRFRPFS
jgi:hypothetical protein